LGKLLSLPSLTGEFDRQGQKVTKPEGFLSEVKEESCRLPAGTFVPL
jgi:hypothetical protein